MTAFHRKLARSQLCKLGGKRTKAELGDELEDPKLLGLEVVNEGVLGFLRIEYFDHQPCAVVGLPGFGGSSCIQCSSDATKEVEVDQIPPVLVVAVQEESRGPSYVASIAGTIEGQDEGTPDVLAQQSLAR